MASARVCIVAPEFVGPFHNGGVGTACYWQAKTLARAGYDVTVLYTGVTEQETPAYWEAHYASSADFCYVDLSRWGESFCGSPAAAPTAVSGEERTSLLVLEYLVRHCFALVHFQEFLGHGARALQARESGLALTDTRTTVTLHSCRQWIYEGMGRLPSTRHDAIVDFLERESAQLADRVIAPSHHMAAWVRERWRLDRHIDVIPNCFDDSDDTRDDRIEHAGPFTHLIFFGRLETRKGLHLFVRALERRDALRRHVRRVTFLGRHSRVEGRPSEAFLDAASARLTDMQMEVRSDMGSLEALAWLSAQRGALVVAPSLGDNLPYAAVELHTRRIPFVSTRIGGIPDIVGAANDHQLAEATADDLAAVLERICRSGVLSVDYSAGYNAAAANQQHVVLTAELTGTPRASQSPVRRGEMTIVVTDTASHDDVRVLRQRFVDAGADISGARAWLTLSDWQRQPGARPVVLMPASVTPQPAMLPRLLDALQRDDVSAATSFYTVSDAGANARLITPLGASLENGWHSNCFGGPVFIARPHVFDAITTPAHGRFSTWPIYAAVASQHRLAIVPEPLYDVAHTEEQPSVADVTAVVARYGTGAASSLNLGWMLKTLMVVSDGTAAAQTDAYVGRRLYDRLLSMPDAELRAFAALDPSAEDDALISSLMAMRRQLASFVEQWHAVRARVFICGAGPHARLLLAAYPALGRLVAGFVDRAHPPEFLGKPCVHPDDVRDGMADVIVYPSREYERDMFAHLREARVEHVPLYPSASTH